MLESEMAFATVDYILLWVAASLAILGTSFRVYLGVKYSRLIDEVDQMTTTKNRELKRCKVKYEKCYAMNQGVANVGAFVDRFLSKLSLGPFTYLALYQMGAQLILLSVIFMALLICHRILVGESLLRLLPYYVGCFAGLYVFFGNLCGGERAGKKKCTKNQFGRLSGESPDSKAWQCGAEPCQDSRGGTIAGRGCGENAFTGWWPDEGVAGASFQSPSNNKWTSRCTDTGCISEHKSHKRRRRGNKRR